MRYGLIFSTVFAIFGVVLVSGCLVMVPYTVMERVRVDNPKTWVDDTFVLMPFNNRTYELDSIIKNTSILQVDVDVSGFVLFKIISDDTGELWSESPRSLPTYFWTPPKMGYDVWDFVFHNPGSTPVNVTAKVTEYYFKATEYEEVTYHRSLFDLFYGYNGIAAIIVAIGLNVIHLIREAKNRNYKVGELS
jgi:hypothetical protein